MRNVTLNLAGIVVLLALTTSLQSAVITIDDSAGTGPGSGFSETGTWGIGYGIPAVGGTYSYPADALGGKTATYTPGAVSGFVAGTYDVYASWGVYSADLGVTYTVNHVGGSSSPFVFDNTKNAAQGATGSLPSVSPSGSGFRFLGTYNLDASSNVVLSGITGQSAQADAVMFRSPTDGKFIDQQSASLTTNNPAAWTMYGATTVPSGNYSATGTSGVTATWAGIPTTGLYDLQVSWGVHSTHSQNVKYLVDVNGNGIQDSGDTLFTINQTKLADQATSGDGVWSGYRDLGSFTLTNSSKLIQLNEGGTGAMTVAPMLARRAQAITIDDGAGTGAGTGFARTGEWTSGAAPAVGGQYSWPGSTGLTATYTPGNVSGSGFVAGRYDVYVSWGVYEADSSVSYTVNHANGSSSPFSFNNRLNAAQGVSGSLPSTSISGSGFWYLGTYTLDASSNVVLSGGNVSFQADAVMFRPTVDGKFIDQQSANLTTNNPAAWTMAGTPTSPSGNYHYTTTAGVTATWAGIIPAAGLYDLQISWGVYPTHSTAVKYLIDVNGNGINDPGDQLFTIDQSKMADQATGGNINYGLWSGYFDLGAFNLTSSSKVLQWTEVQGSNTAMTVAPMLVTLVPEPSTLVLMATALLGLLAYAWRKRR